MRYSNGKLVTDSSNDFISRDAGVTITYERDTQDIDTNENALRNAIADLLS